VAISVIQAILVGKRAWTSAAQLRNRFGAPALAELAAAGKIVGWDTDPAGKKLRAPSWTLTPWYASSLGVSIAETPDPLGCGVPYWTAGDVAEFRRRIGLGAPRLRPGPTPKARVARSESGEVIMLWGMGIPVDPRLGPKGRPGRRRAAGRPKGPPATARGPGARPGRRPLKAIGV
jgi:hypothetical protein